MKNKKISLTSFVLILLAFVVLLFAKPASAGTLSQATYSTPTPNADGQIIYIVQEGETCTIISLKTLLTIDEISTLNNLGADCEIYAGQPLILGTVAPATATLEAPAQTSTPSGPTPTPFEGTGEVCVVLFEDLDGNQMRAESELYLSGGVISVNNRAGTYSETGETLGGDPAVVEMLCFEDVPEGEYNLSMGIPDGYIATTSLNYALEVTPGDTVVIDFGAQPSSQFNTQDEVDVSANRSPLLLAIGLFLLAGGAGLAFFFIRSRQGS
ncbi:MAG: LysM domain-containing protein [Brevefilum sp.]|nr:LysM domain-containing protein [Brevefilum sp.]MDT8380921.1 LysM domain-containing protein [Brevefilum sp.]